MTEPRFGSSCCGASYHTEPPKEQITDSTTVWYACDECGQPCNVIDLDGGYIAKLRAVAEAASKLVGYPVGCRDGYPPWAELENALAALDAEEQLPVATCQLPEKAESRPRPTARRRRIC